MKKFLIISATILSAIILSKIFAATEVKVLKGRNKELTDQISELKKENMQLSEDNISLQARINDSTDYSSSTDYSTDYSSNSSTDSYSSSSNSYSSSEPYSITLSNGSYTVGIDIEPGIYDVEAISGYGILTGDFASGYVSMGIGISDRYPDDKSYTGLKLIYGDEFTIKSGVTLEFTRR